MRHFCKRSMEVKKVFLVLLVMFVVAAGILYYFRYDIFQVSAETIIKKNLPPFVSVGSIIFDLKNGVLEVRDFGIKNPGGYKDKHLATIGRITCRYKMKGKNVLDGLEVTEITADRPLINIERLSDGRLNINEMEKVMQPGKPEKPVREKVPFTKKGPSRVNIADFLKLTDTINLRNARVIFTDKAVRPTSVLTFDNIGGDIVLKLTDDYRGVRSVESRGAGMINGDASQSVKWTVWLDPNTQRLTMSNRYEVRGADVIPFKPYYDEYSPIDIRSGWFSGTLVIDFDNGSIGSQNTLKLRGLKFAVKEGAPGAGFWEAAVPDIIEYLRTAPGEIMFDFKIKGDMKNPRFYPGPILKRAIQAKVVDTITETIQRISQDGQGQAAPGQKTDAEQVVDALRGLLKE